MTKKRTEHHIELDPAAERLVLLTAAQVESGSRVEDRYWEAQLDQHIVGLLEHSDDESLMSALDHLYDQNIPAHENLADCIEACIENPSVPSAGREVLLIAIPLLAWSRYRIPATTLPAPVLEALRVCLKDIIAAPEARIAVADFIFSPDQLPQGYCTTSHFSVGLGQLAHEDSNMHIDASDMPETVHFLSDIRYILASVSVPAGQAFFKWQTFRISKEEALKQWQQQALPLLAPLMTGCALEAILPEPFFTANRQADRHSRAYSIHASTAFITTEFDAPPAGLRAVIAPFYEQQLEEYRIGLILNQNEQLIHGITWPLWGAEDETTDVAAEIEAVLRQCGVNDIVTLDIRFPMEYCDDCGSPLYPTADGELVHVEIPDDYTDHPPKHLH